MSLSRRQRLLALGLALALLAFALLDALPIDQRLMAGVFVLAAFYWITEPVPLYVTGILAAFLSSLLLGVLSARLGGAPHDYAEFLTPFASPVVVLMFGGFVMARVFSKHDLDLAFCRGALARLGERPGRVLLGMMALTAALSMWMSNTAATAIMVSSLLPIVRGLPRGSTTGRAFMLAVPFAANIGGIATPIGTPPNAIALGLLAERGIHLSFLAWMLAGLPVMLILLLACYLLLRRLLPLDVRTLRVALPEGPPSARRNLVYGTFAVTVLLWLTDAYHGIPSALIALVPVTVFAVAGLFGKELLRDLAWDILLLIGGGLALGAGIKATGLGQSVVGALSLDGLPPLAATLVLGAAVCLLGTFMSHTASSNIVLPLAMTVAAASPAQTAVTVALCASFGMALPVSTPPNAIAYGSELIPLRDMARAGAIMTGMGLLLTLLYEQVLFAVAPALLGAAP